MLIGARSPLRITVVAVAVTAFFVFLAHRAGNRNDNFPALAVSTTTPPSGVPSPDISATPVVAPRLLTRVQAGQLVDGFGAPRRLLGVSLSGTESACILDKGFAWGPLNRAQADIIASWHINAVRVPMNEDCWLGINGVSPAYSGSAYQQAIKIWIDNLNAAGLIAIPTLQNSTPGTAKAMGQATMPDADHSVRFWTEVATTFADYSGVIFGAFNEPQMAGKSASEADWDCWRNGCFQQVNPGCKSACNKAPYRSVGMQTLVDTIRSTGALQPILVGGLGWAGDPCGMSSTLKSGDDCEWVTHRPNDPAGQLIASMHTYPWTNCATQDCWDQALTQLATIGVPLVVDEFGEADCSAAFMDSLMKWGDSRGVSYLAWAWNTNNQRATTCQQRPDGSPTGPAVMNIQLLQGFDGRPNQVAPQGAALKAHLEAVWNGD